MDSGRFGQITIAATNTAQQLTNVGSSAGGFVIKAFSTNAGAIYIGHDNTLTAANGFELTAGQSLGLELLSIGRLWIYGAQNDKICWAKVNG